MRKLAPARVSYQDDFLISCRVYTMTGSPHILLFEGTLHVDKIHVWFKIANIRYPFDPVYRQTDFTPKRVVVTRLHDTAARFRSGGKFSLRYNNRVELPPGWTRSGAKVAPVSCKHPLRPQVRVRDCSLSACIGIDQMKISRVLARI